MTAVPYTFANQTGNIPLSQLDDNFATLANAVPAYADAAGIATVAVSAGSAGIAATVTSNVQANITSVGTLTFLDVAGNISANYFIGNGSALTGVVASSVNAGNLVGNTLSSNIVNSSLTTVGNLTNLNVIGNAQASNINVLQDIDVAGVGYIYNISSTGTSFLTTVTADTVSATGNVTGGNIATANAVIAGRVIASGNITGGNLRSNGLTSSTGNVTAPWFVGNVSATTVNTTTLSAAGNVNVGNFLIANIFQATNAAIVGNITAGGTISAVGNITGNKLEGIRVVTNFINSDDSTGVTVEDNLILAGDLEINGQAIITQSVTVPNLTVSNISSDDSTDVTVDHDLTVTGDLDVVGGLRVFGRPLTLPSFTSAQIANISAVNGDLIYNTTLNKFQGYENGSWANII